jgi:hypothetical protein
LNSTPIRLPSWRNWRTCWPGQSSYVCARGGTGGRAAEAHAVEARAHRTHSGAQGGCRSSGDGVFVCNGGYPVVDNHREAPPAERREEPRVGKRHLGNLDRSGEQWRDQRRAKREMQATGCAGLRAQEQQRAWAAQGGPRLLARERQTDRHTNRQSSTRAATRAQRWSSRRHQQFSLLKQRRRPSRWRCQLPWPSLRRPWHGSRRTIARPPAAGVPPHSCGRWPRARKTGRVASGTSHGV